ncbi:nucleotide-binding protein [Methanothrix sp.]|uniref:nucleotide-binding protein n=1 Tax=Methanothrix sp. TaxID=90426 RepID=UPI003BB75F7C
MAKVPIEVVIVGETELADVPAAISLANSEQNEFLFSIVTDDIARRVQMYTLNKNNVSEFFDHIEGVRNEIRGYHPFLIVATDSKLEGKRLGNLFGSHRAKNGIAVFTTSLVPDVIIPDDRMISYFVYYFARYALSFISPNHRDHDDSRGCVFDRKIQKKDIVKSMGSHPLCDDCKRDLVKNSGLLSANQLNAIEKLFLLAGLIFRKGLQRNGKACIFIGSSTEGLRIANKLQELLSNDFSVIVWDQGTVFGLGTSTLEALEAAVLQYDFAVFVFTPDDKLYTRGTTIYVPRDNVIFELGMFIGKLGRLKAFAVHPVINEMDLPSDLKGITTAIYDPTEDNLAAALGPAANRIRNAILKAD